MASDFVSCAYAIDRFAMPPEVGVWAPILGVLGVPGVPDVEGVVFLIAAAIRQPYRNYPSVMVIVDPGETLAPEAGETLVTVLTFLVPIFRTTTLNPRFSRIVVAFNSVSE